jgi:hypothetical protein
LLHRVPRGDERAAPLGRLDDDGAERHAADYYLGESGCPP